MGKPDPPMQQGVYQKVDPLSSKFMGFHHRSIENLEYWIWSLPQFSI
jgi:hypothetical protein